MFINILLFDLQSARKVIASLLLIRTIEPFLFSYNKANILMKLTSKFKLKS